jgi:hypothetical protein
LGVPESDAVEGDDVADCVTGLASRVVVKRDRIKMLRRKLKVSGLRSAKWRVAGMIRDEDATANDMTL